MTYEKIVLTKRYLSNHNILFLLLDNGNKGSVSSIDKYSCNLPLANTRGENEGSRNKQDRDYNDSYLKS